MVRKYTLSFKSINKDLPLFLLIAGIHLTIAILYKEIVGLDIAANPRYRPWDWWWQTIPVDLLMNRLWESIWYLHAQPPLYNLYGAFFYTLFPENGLSAMQVGNMIFGSLIPAMFYLLLKKMTGRTTLSFIVGLVLALDPALFLFEAYILYDLLTTFLVAASALLIAWFEKNRHPRFAYLFIISVNLLVLLRSVYHILVIGVAIVMVFFAATEKRKRILTVCALISLVSVGWYTKNVLLYDFFGASSWQGMGLWEVVTVEQSNDQLRQLADRGVLDPMVAEVEGHSPPSEYFPYGFTLKSNIPLLNQDNHHNINIIAISKVYQKNALRLIVEHPKAYARAVMRAYQVYNLPTATFKHHILNAEKILLHVNFTAQYLQGNILDNYSGFDFGSLDFFLIPLGLMSLGGYLVVNTIKTKHSVLIYLKNNPTEIWIAFLVVYTTLVSIFFEIGENNRERFYIEQLFFVFLILFILKFVRKGKNPPNLIQK
jgi:hypothetical protein